MNTWIKRSAALFATAAAAVAVMAPDASALTQSAAVPFTVQATVNAACTVASAANLTFASYTLGQTPSVTSTSDIEINCPGGGMTVQMSFAPIIVGSESGFQMSLNGAGAANAELTYSLCDNAVGCAGTGGTYPITGLPTGLTVAVNSVGTATTSYTLLGTITGGQSPTGGAGAYKQSVNAFVNF